jgi:hypothetical protein
MIKKVFNIAKVAVLIIAVLSSILVIRQRRENRRLTNNLNLRTHEYEDLKGRTVLQSEAYEVTLKEIRQARRIDSVNRNEYQAKLAYAEDVIRTLNKKLNRVESVNVIGIESKKTDTVYIKIENDSLIIESLKSKHWNIDFAVHDSKVMVADLTYSANIDIVIDRDKRLKADGSKRFIICRIIKPDWTYSSSVVIDDPDAKIKTNVFYNFK